MIKKSFGIQDKKSYRFQQLEGVFVKLRNHQLNLSVVKDKAAVKMDKFGNEQK